MVTMSMVSAAETVLKIKENVEQLTRLTDDEGSGMVAKKTLELYELCDQLSMAPAANRELQCDVEKCAVLLWNWVVVKISAGVLTPECCASIRQTAFQLISMVSGEEDEQLRQRQVTMALKTGRAWLDCRKPEKADFVLHEALKKLDCMYTKLKSAESADSCGLNNRAQVECDMVKALSCIAQSSFEQGKFEDGIKSVRKAKELLRNLPEEQFAVSMMCYNFGVEAYESQKYEESVAWLQESYHIGQVVIDSSKQARTLRLLTNVFIEWDVKKYGSQALDAVTLANSVKPSTSGIYLMVKVLLHTNGSVSQCCKAFEDLINDPGFELESAISLVRCATQNNRLDFAVAGIELLITRYNNRPECGQIDMLHIETLLELGRLEDANKVIESCITKDRNSKQPMDSDVKNKFHGLMWQNAAKCFENSEFTEALQWYNYSLSVFADETDGLNLAKIYRNKAGCLLALGKLTEALDCVAMAEKYDPTSPYNQFIKFKVLLAMDNGKEASAVLPKMCALCSEGSGLDNMHSELICLAAQLAFEKTHQEAAMSALSCLVDVLPNSQQLVTVLRLLIRLRLTMLLDDEHNYLDLAKICSYVQKAHKALEHLTTEKSLQKEAVAREASWFMKIAWNLAIQSSNYSQQMGEMFELCYKFSCLTGDDCVSLVRDRTCLLMAAASGLECGKKMKQGPVQDDTLHKVLGFIETCKGISEKLAAVNSALKIGEAKSKDNTAVLLLLYEFEAKVYLGYHGLELLLERALQMANSEPKTFETIAALSMTAGHENRSVATRAVKVAIKKYIQQHPVDNVKCSKLFQSLIQLTLGQGYGDDSRRDEACQHFTDALNFIDNTSQNSYPQTELLWLMTRAWNCGIHLYCSSRYKDAERWCALSMRFLNHLRQLKTTYVTKMTKVYGEILSRLESTRKS